MKYNIRRGRRAEGPSLYILIKLTCLFVCVFVCVCLCVCTYGTFEELVRRRCMCMVWIEAKFMRMCQKNTKIFVRLLFRTPVAEIRTPVEKKSLFFALFEIIKGVMYEIST